VGPPLLELKDITVMRGDRVALDRFTLRIEKGEHVCLLGPNGCGKSTLIKTLTRELYPLVVDGASMAILGQDRWDVAELRTMLGIVSPDLLAMCTTRTTGRDVVLSGFFSSTRIFPHRHRVTPDLAARADAAMARLGIAHLADRPLDEMSSGEAKRTVVARALVHDPHSLVFDEPSSTLDIGAQFELREAMRKLAQSGTGVVLVTHHVHEIIPEIERVVLLRNGRVAGDGPKESMLTERALRETFGAEVRLMSREGYFYAY